MSRIYSIGSPNMFDN